MIVKLQWFSSVSVSVTGDVDATEVKTSMGLIKGKIVNYPEGRKVYEYLGIPFAKPPLGDLRYKDPEPAASFPGKFLLYMFFIIDSRMLFN